MDLLLEVEDCFALRGLGLVLSPDLSRPHSEAGAEYPVLVERPDGTSTAAVARVRVRVRFVHLRLVGYKLQLFLTNIDKDETPLGQQSLKCLKACDRFRHRASCRYAKIPRPYAQLPCKSACASRHQKT